MEYRCRLGTPGGEIIEGVYAADSEARLRREFEEKGLLVLAIHQAGRRNDSNYKIPESDGRCSRVSFFTPIAVLKAWQRTLVEEPPPTPTIVPPATTGASAITVPVPSDGPDRAEPNR